MKNAFLTLIFFTSLSVFAASDDVVIVTCTENGRQPGFKSLEVVTQPSGKMRGRVTVADGRETYSYFVRRLPPIVRRSGGSLVYRAALARFQLNICTTCGTVRNQAFHATLAFRAPKRTTVYQRDQIVEFKDLACVIR